MNFKTTFVAVAAMAWLGLASGATAATVFSDGFEADAAGAPVGSLINFDIVGTVDVVQASNPYGIVTTSNVVDLDGTPGPGGITSKNAFAFGAGDLVTLSFVLGGSQRGDVSDDVGVSLLFGAPTSVLNFTGTGFFSFVAIGNTTLSPTFTATQSSLAGNAPFSLSTLSFTAVNAGSLKFGFNSGSANNIGPLLDSVQLDVGSAVPEPATWAFMISGFGMAGAALRRRRLLPTA
jgi:hypothetical protein